LRLAPNAGCAQITAVTTSRLFADRRHGVDRRAVPRRHLVAGAAPERRRVVDRRRGADRRSTLERRGVPSRNPALESPSEHLRNALQLLAHTHLIGQPEFEAALVRVARALELLEKQRTRR
jgi:hypothetical protein